jgi:hypothetical protein
MNELFEIAQHAFQAGLEASDFGRLFSSYSDTDYIGSADLDYRSTKTTLFKCSNYSARFNVGAIRSG